MAIQSITILGGRGMLGRDLAQAAQDCGLGVRSFDLPELDITDPQALERAAEGADAIVNCAAFTDVEMAESRVALANQVNGYAVGRLGQIAKEAGLPVVHISTDFVFDGTKDGPYAESDKPCPVNVYGSSKLLGEVLLAESGCHWCIVRVQWTYGRHGRNFITKITEAARQRSEVQVVADQVGCPTHTLDAARILCRMLMRTDFPEGLFHLAAGGCVSRYEMTCYLFERLGIQTPVRPCRSADFKTAARRPLNSCFDCTKLQTLLGTPIRSWQEMLNDYLEML
ncbi:MAG TPA: dTDP-4-dehydrorhamnose reductase [Anaerohalosphaeraceae bacterium]|nr:dTDP-4-dehydrorhamnose reductase [Anaerohalosphaeraceae bacterium]HPO70817.1 dTDP-4-dehydrorhamnose reductase [Anaerohalosphaeraceae bacterium]